MGIEINNGDETQTELKVEAPRSAFAGVEMGATTAPVGNDDFLSVISRIGASQIDSQIKPYLDTVMGIVNAFNNLPNAKLVQLERLSNAYALRYDSSDGTRNFFGLQFVNSGDSVGPNFVPVSQRIASLVHEIRARFGNDGESRVRVVDSRIVMADYPGDMKRAEQMANVIVTHFNVAANPVFKDKTVDFLRATEFAIDWSVTQARNVERQLSPHGVEPRMDIGMVLKAKIPPVVRPTADYEPEWKIIGVVGGYVDFGEQEPFNINGQNRLLYRPVVNITVLNAVVPLEGLGALLLSAFIPNVYNKPSVWVRQFSDFSEGMPNPGMLEKDPSNPGRPMVIRNGEELREFVQNMCSAPLFVFQTQDGADCIPGMYRLTNDIRPEEKRHLIARIAQFFKAAELPNMDVSRTIASRHEGVFGDTNGVLKDSRLVDYLYVAAKNGYSAINDDIRRTLLSPIGNAVDRARVVQQMVGGFSPVYTTTLSVVNLGLVEWIGSCVRANGINIIDPNATVEARPIGSYLDGFASPNILPTVVTTGNRNNGLNLNSVWSGLNL